MIVLSLVLASTSILTVASACQDALRGFERMDFAAATYVGGQLLTALVVIPTLLLGGGVRLFLGAQLTCTFIGAMFVLWMLPRMGVPKITWRSAAVIIQLQPLIDAAMLSKFAASDAVGWHAAARRLVGLLIYPASAMAAALYPTLCRLHAENLADFKATTARALHLLTIAVVPVALGCALFPELGVSIFSERSYGPAEDNLRLLSIYVLLVYFSIPVGSSLMAAGKQLHWAIVQSLCVVVSIVADPPLIHWFQLHAGNGGLGVCVSTGASEILMISAGIYLMPSGVLDKSLLKKLAAAALGGVCMTAVALSMPALNAFIRAPLAVLVYCACIWFSGAIDAAQVRAARNLFKRS
jgi:O-antigen/teichoic acid export membrane protein